MAEFDFQKKDHRLLIAGSMDVLPRGADKFSHDSSSGKSFQTLPDPLLKGAGINFGTGPGLFSQCP